MSSGSKKHRKTTKVASTNSNSDEDSNGLTRAVPPPLSVAARIANFEQLEGGHASLSSEMSDVESPRSMVHGIIEVINGRVTAQLSDFLSNEITALLAVTRAEIVSEVQANTIKMCEKQTKELDELRRKVDSYEKAQKKQDQWTSAEAELVAEVQKQQSDYIVLNVGGVEYATARSTMVKYPQSMLGAMFSGRYQLVTDPQGRHFIDRDGLLFRHILNYLRTDSVSSVDVTDISALIEILQESVYFQIESLTQLLTAHLAKADAAENSPLQRYRSREWEDAASSHRQQSGHLGITVPPPSDSAHVKRLSVPGSSSSSSSSTNEQARHLIRNISTTPRTRRVAAAEHPAYTREEVHQITLKYGERRRINMCGLDLRGIDLSKLDLRNIDFSRANLQEASFEGAHLVGCSFSQANLRQTNFQQAFFGETPLDCPDFTDAELQGANFSRYEGTLFRSRFEGVEIHIQGLDPRWLR